MKQKRCGKGDVFRGVVYAIPLVASLSACLPSEYDPVAETGSVACFKAFRDGAILAREERMCVVSTDQCEALGGYVLSLFDQYASLEECQSVCPSYEDIEFSFLDDDGSVMYCHERVCVDAFTDGPYAAITGAACSGNANGDSPELFYRKVGADIDAVDDTAVFFGGGGVMKICDWSAHKRIYCGTYTPTSYVLDDFPAHTYDITGGVIGDERFSVHIDGHPVVEYVKTESWDEATAGAAARCGEYDSCSEDSKRDISDTCQQYCIDSTDCGKDEECLRSIKGWRCVPSKCEKCWSDGLLCSYNASDCGFNECLKDDTADISDTCGHPCTDTTDCRTGEACLNTTVGRICIAEECHTCFKRDLKCSHNRLTCEFLDCEDAEAANDKPH